MANIRKMTHCPYIYVEAKNICHNLEINDWYRRQRCCNKKGVTVSTEGRKQRKKMGNSQGRVAKMLLWANVDLDRKKRPGHWYPEEVFSLLVVELLNQWYNWETLDPCVCVRVVLSYLSMETSRHIIKLKCCQLQMQLLFRNEIVQRKQRKNEV